MALSMKWASIPIRKLCRKLWKNLRMKIWKAFFQNEEERKKLFNSVKDVNIDTDLELMLPDDYVNSTEERLLLYQNWQM